MTDAMLIVEKGVPSMEPIMLSEKTLTIGSSTSADIRISNHFVSRRHCQMDFQKGVFLIRDLESKNGTFVNGVPVSGNNPRELRDGDIVELAVNAVKLSFRSLSTDTMTQTITLTSVLEKVRVNTGSREVWIDGIQIDPPLSPKEFDVLALLFANQGEVVSKDDIASSAWPERDGDVGNHEIEQCIRRIRRRIEEDPSNPTLIVTRKGVGYQLT